MSLEAAGIDFPTPELPTPFTFDYPPLSELGPQIEDHDWPPSVDDLGPDSGWETDSDEVPRTIN